MTLLSSFKRKRGGLIPETGMKEVKKRESALKRIHYQEIQRRGGKGRR